MMLSRASFKPLLLLLTEDAPGLKRRSGVGGRGSEVGRRKSDVGGRGSEVEQQRSEIGGRGSDVGGRRSEVEQQRSEIGERGSEVEQQRSEIGERGSEVEQQRSEIGERGSEVGQQGTENGERTTETRNDGCADDGYRPDTSSGPDDIFVSVDLPADVLSSDRLSAVRCASTYGQGTSRTIIRAARRAYAEGFTHILPLRLTLVLRDISESLQPLLQAAAQHPESVILGHRPAAGFKAARLWRRVWFRIQTGQQLTDSQSDAQVYPLLLFEHLRLWHREFTLPNELLVKAAWAGVSIHEVTLDPSAEPLRLRMRLGRRVRCEVQLALLNFVLTLRAVWPWPHKRVPGLSAYADPVSLRHPLQSLRHLRRQNMSPRQLAAAGALGVFLGALPLFALHTVTILFSAGYLGLNRMVALSTSQLCMPPLVPALCISLGYYLRHGRFLTELSVQTLGYQAHERLLEWLLGSLLLAPLLAVGIGGLIYGSAWMVFRNMPDAKPGPDG